MGTLAAGENMEILSPFAGGLLHSGTVRRPHPVNMILQDFLLYRIEESRALL
jgi:hypothetical protein